MCEVLCTLREENIELCSEYVCVASICSFMNMALLCGGIDVMRLQYRKENLQLKSLRKQQEASLADTQQQRSEV